MNKNDPASGGTTPDTASATRDKEAVKHRLRSEADTAASAARNAADSAYEEAKAIGEEAAHFAEDQADKLKDATAAHMEVFADALNAASAELGKQQSGPAAELVTHAASGLETLSRSLHGKSTAELLDSVRAFGRQNPVGFVAGSLLAGFALSRFAVAASATGDSATGRNTSAGSADRASSPTQASSATAGSSQGGTSR